MATRSIIVCDGCGKDIKPADDGMHLTLLALCDECNSPALVKVMAPICDIIARLSYGGLNYRADKRSVTFINGLLRMEVSAPTNSMNCQEQR